MSKALPSSRKTSPVITMLLIAAFGDPVAATIVVPMLLCMICAVVHPYVQRHNARLRRRERRRRQRRNRAARKRHAAAQGTP